MKNLLLTIFITLAFAFSVQAADKESPMTVTGATTISASEAKGLFDEGVLFIDVRSDKDWAAGRIPDAVHIELKKQFNQDSMSAEVGKDEKVVLYCNGASCMRSSDASAQAVSWGFSKVYYFRDGFPAWKSAGYPVE